MPRSPPASKAVDPIIRYSHADWAEVTVVRLRFVQGYERVAKTDRIDVQLSYLNRYRGFWILNGVAWGMWPLLFYGRLPAAATVACWMLTAGVGGVAIASMSAHLRATRAFLM